MKFEAADYADLGGLNPRNPRNPRLNTRKITAGSGQPPNKEEERFEPRITRILGDGIRVIRGSVYSWIRIP